MVDALQPHGHEPDDIDSLDKALQRIADLEVEGQRLYRLLHKFKTLRVQIRGAEASLRKRDDKLIAELDALFQSKPIAQLPEVTRIAPMPPVKEPRAE